MRRPMGLTRAAFLPAFLIASWVSGPAWACAVCFGNPESPQTLGMQYAMLALLAVVLSVLLSLAMFFVYLLRRSKKYEREKLV